MMHHGIQPGGGPGSLPHLEQAESQPTTQLNQGRGHVPSAVEGAATQPSTSPPYLRQRDCRLPPAVHCADELGIPLLAADAAVPGGAARGASCLHRERHISGL